MRNLKISFSGCCNTEFFSPRFSMLIYKFKVLLLFRFSISRSMQFYAESLLQLLNFRYECTHNWEIINNSYLKSWLSIYFNHNCYIILPKVFSTHSRFLKNYSKLNSDIPLPSFSSPIHRKLIKAIPKMKTKQKTPFLSSRWTQARRHISIPLT